MTDPILNNSSAPSNGSTYIPEIRPFSKGYIVTHLVLCLATALVGGAVLTGFIIHVINSPNDDPSVAFFILLGLFVFMIFCSMIYGLFISMMILYRAWLVLQPLKQIRPYETYDLSSPGMTVGLMFVPYFNLYWQFPAYLGLEKYGQMMSQARNRPYTGPSRNLILMSLISNFLWAGVFIFPFFFPFLAIGQIILYYLMMIKINDMIGDLGKPYIIASPSACGSENGQV